MADSLLHCTGVIFLELAEAQAEKDIFFRILEELGRGLPNFSAFIETGVGIFKGRKNFHLKNGAYDGHRNKAEYCLRGAVFDDLRFALGKKIDGDHYEGAGDGSHRASGNNQEAEEHCDENVLSMRADVG